MRKSVQRVFKASNFPAVDEVKNDLEVVIVNKQLVGLAVEEEKETILSPIKTLGASIEYVC